MLPGFLRTLADALPALEEDFYSTHQAAHLSAHPMYQALHEFRVLRGVLLEVFQEHGTIGSREREIIHSAIDPGLHGEGAGDVETQDRALSDEEALNRLLVESARDFAMFTLDLDRRVVTWNPGAERITGYTGEEIIGQSGDVL